MNIPFKSLRVFSFLLLVIVLGACGSKGASPSPTNARGQTAAGDIPDTATYVTYKGNGFHIKYVEGWSIVIHAHGVTISDKDSLETVTVSSSSRPVQEVAARDHSLLARHLAQFHFLRSQVVPLHAGPAPYLQYRTLSASDPVTNKRVPVIVDRYYVPGSGKYAVITLATPLGVDNIDAFRLISHSFRWG